MRLTSFEKIMSVSALSAISEICDQLINLERYEFLFLRKLKSRAS